MSGNGPLCSPAIGQLLLVDLAKIQYTRDGEGPDL